MKYAKLRNFFKFISKTPLHPQWLISRNGENRFIQAAQQAHGLVVDVGCSEQNLRQYLPATCKYIGIDYLDTVQEMYETLPDLYGNAECLPFEDESVDTVALLEVLEHLPNPHDAVREIYRILKPGGSFILSVPFFYPVHDAPYDFQRYTIYGLRNLAADCNFEVEEEFTWGNPLSTSACLVNIALVRSSLEGINNKSPAALALLSLPILIPLFNIAGFLAEKIKDTDPFMALTYTFVLRRK